ncbi:MAG: hypothetical protein K0R54_351 [Clostridiaceae bacterium]|jgi:hypothetical protein|nr:hypothetical protein [Clostridiaceae bacterium]
MYQLSYTKYVNICIGGGVMFNYNLAFNIKISYLELAIGSNSAENKMFI